MTARLIQLRRFTSILIRHRRPVRYWACLQIIALYIPLCAVAFWLWVNPSLTGATSQHIAADSSTYIYMADVLREHIEDPAVYAALARFPNTLWMPVGIAYALNSTVLTVVFNLGLLSLSLMLIGRAVDLDIAYLLFLLLLNPTTVISLLSVNKEIVDLLIVACFCCFLARRSRACLFVALVLALFNRYEFLICLLLFMAMRSRLNPWRGRRWSSLVLLLCGFTILLPLGASHALAERFVEAEGGGIVTFLDQMEMHFLFIFAALPKIAENLLGELLNPATVARYTFEDLANSYILLFNNCATAFVIVRLWMKGRFKVRSIRSDLVYLAAITSIVMSVSLVIQPRYFYVVYVLLCMEATRREPRDGWIRNSLPTAALSES